MTTTTIARWPLRFGFTALVTIEGESADAPVVDPRQSHMVGCQCTDCLARRASTPPAPAGEGCA